MFSRMGCLSLLMCVAAAQQAQITCDNVRAEYERIASCNSDGQCGQLLRGTSCGCTRNLVARNDADASTFYNLLENAEGSCFANGITICDCPEVEFVCDEGLCSSRVIIQPLPQSTTNFIVQYILPGETNSNTIIDTMIASLRRNTREDVSFIRTLTQDTYLVSSGRLLRRKWQIRRFIRRAKRDSNFISVEEDAIVTIR